MYLYIHILVLFYVNNIVHTSTIVGSVVPLSSVIDPRRACAVRVTVVILCVCLCVCLFTTILATQATKRLMSDTNSLSATRA